MNEPCKGKMLVIGARGIVGRSVTQYFSQLPSWDVIGVSRGKPEFGKNLNWINLDLRDEEPAKQTWRICLIKHTFVILQYLKSLTLLEVGQKWIMRRLIWRCCKTL